MARKSPNRKLLFAILLASLLALVAGVAFLGYFLARTLRPGRGGGEVTDVEVVAPFPGASPEEVERQVTIPLEVGLAGMPGLQAVRSRSSLGAAVLRLRFDDGYDYHVARHEVINRLQFVNLPAGVVARLSSAPPGREVFRYTLASPKDMFGQDIYTLHDLKALQDWVLEREFRRVPRVAGVEGWGGTVKRFEVHPDPDRLRRYGVTLQQVESALANSNQNVGGDDVKQGQVALTVRGIGLFGGGEDPFQAKAVREARDPRDAARHLRAEEERRLREIRQTVLASVNGVPIRVEDVVEGGRQLPGEENRRGVVVGGRAHGRVALCRPRGEDQRAGWLDEERVQGIVLLRPGEDREAALCDIRAKVEELNAGGLLPPGVRVEPFRERDGRREDGFWMRADFPATATDEKVAEHLREARAFLRQQPEVGAVLTQAGCPDEAAPNPGSAAAFVVLQPGNAGPRATGQLKRDVAAELRRLHPGVTWTHLAGQPDDFAEVFEAAPGEVVLKVFGRDLEGLQRIAEQAKQLLEGPAGLEDVRRLDGGGTTGLDLRVDRQKCARWGVSAADVNLVIQSATGRHVVSQMVEGEKLFEIVLCWPASSRLGEAAILDLPVDVTNQQAVPEAGALKGGAPAVADPLALLGAGPRLRLRDLVSPVGEDGAPDPGGRFVRRGVASIYRENGQRLVTVRFRLDGASLDEVRGKVAALIPPPCRAEWLDR
jgi:Cu/Ag efflux pump CusA